MDRARTYVLGVAFAAVVLAALVLACRHPAPPVALDAAVPADAVAEAGTVVQLAPAPTDGGAAPTIEIAAIDSPVPISNRPEWPPRDPTKASDERIGVVRLGYLRKGDHVLAKPTILQKPTCTEGWYELVSGGFVCGKSVTRDMNAKELADAPHPPLTDGPLPYEYALNLTTGTPLYRRKVTREERKQYERGLPVGKTEPKAPGEAPSGSAGGGGDTPWYLKEGARKQVSLNELQAHEGPVVERMVRGFYLSLDKKVSFYSGSFWRTAQGFYAPAEHVVVHKPKTEFEGDKAVYATIISSGRHDDKDPAKDHRTKMGTFRIREKHISATMDDDSASDGPYSIEDVPWIMYFNGSYALHGAFWHSAFGHERSHGCVNMTPHDAKELFAWAGPTLPQGWHGVRATTANPGTRVIVHE